MKQSFFLFFLLILVSCDPPPVTFNEPQPAGARTLDKIPSSLLGEYQSAADSSVISIAAGYIVRDSEALIELNADSLSEGAILRGDSLIDTLNGTADAIKRSGTHVYIKYTITDSLFTFSSGGILKKFRGHYFLNTHFGDKWEVKMLDADGDMLSLSEAATDKDLEKLRTATASTDTSQTTFSPSKRELNKFIKAEGFSSIEQLRKINPAIFDKNGERK